VVPTIVKLTITIRMQIPTKTQPALNLTQDSFTKWEKTGVKYDRIQRKPSFMHSIFN